MGIYAVLTVAAGLIYYIGKEVMGSFAHPSDETLAQYWSGELKRVDGKTYRQTTEHLATCTDCRDRLDEVRKNSPGPGAADPMISRRY